MGRALSRAILAGIAAASLLLGAASSARSNPCRDGCGFLYSSGTVSNIYGTPGSTFAQAYGINNNDQIVGATGTPFVPLPFLYSGGTYTNLSGPPGSGTTYAFGINDNSQIVGWYFENGLNYGYEYSGDIYTT
jgi:hypothetical protein